VRDMGSGFHSRAPASFNFRQNRETVEFYSCLRSRRERIERLDALATLLDTAIAIPGTNIRFGRDA